MIEQILHHIYARGAKYESAYVNPLIFTIIDIHNHLYTTHTQLSGHTQLSRFLSLKCFFAFS